MDYFVSNHFNYSFLHLVYCISVGLSSLFIHETHFFHFVDDYDALLYPKLANCRKILNKSAAAAYRGFSALQMLIFTASENELLLFCQDLTQKLPTSLRLMGSMENLVQNNVLWHQLKLDADTPR